MRIHIQIRVLSLSQPAPQLENKSQKDKNREEARRKPISSHAEPPFHGFHARTQREDRQIMPPRPSARSLILRHHHRGGFSSGADPQEIHVNRAEGHSQKEDQAGGLAEI